MNRNSVGPFLAKHGLDQSKDVQILGDLVDCVEFLSQHLGWKSELDSLMADQTKSLVS